MGYDSKYYSRHLVQYRDWEMSISRDIVSRYGIKSIIDLGCGVGSYLEGAHEMGIRPLLGLEINYNISRHFTPADILPYIKKADITQPLDFGKFDCAWSIEAAEHIRTEGTEQFLENLCNSAERYVVMSAAPPGQKGTGHINLRPQSFWIKEIASRGFAYLPEEAEKTVEVWADWNRKKIHKVPWYLYRNLMIFLKP